jgi:hypothetical protein
LHATTTNPYLSFFFGPSCGMHPLSATQDQSLLIRTMLATIASYQPGMSMLLRTRQMLRPTPMHPFSAREFRLSCSHHHHHKLHGYLVQMTSTTT